MKDKAKTDYYIRIIEADLDTNKFGVDGFPTKGKAALSIGHAMYYKEMIKALMEKDQDIFTKNMNMESDWSFRFCRADDFTSLPAEDLTVLYDLALGEGMRPKVATPFIPKAVLEHGYWSRI